MDRFTPNNQPILEPKKVWYKTAGGVIFLIIISLFILGVISFMALFGYYAWQVKYGGLEDKTRLAGTFENNFTLDNSLVGIEETKQVVEDYQNYIRDYNPIFGGQVAPITIIAFVDFECLYCQATYQDFKYMMEKYEPVVRIVFKNLPLASLHLNALPSAQASMCAHDQNQFWSYHNILFEKKALDDDSLIEYGKILGLNEAEFSDCLSNQKFINQIMADVDDAVSLGLRGTPTYLVNGLKIEGGISASDWDKIILSLL